MKREKYVYVYRQTNGNLKKCRRQKSKLFKKMFSDTFDQTPIKINYKALDKTSPKKWWSTNQWTWMENLKTFKNLSKNFSISLDYFSRFVVCKISSRCMVPGFCEKNAYSLHNQNAITAKIELHAQSKNAIFSLTYIAFPEKLLSIITSINVYKINQMH